MGLRGVESGVAVVQRRHDRCLRPRVLLNASVVYPQHGFVRRWRACGGGEAQLTQAHTVWARKAGPTISSATQFALTTQHDWVATSPCPTRVEIQRTEDTGAAMPSLNLKTSLNLKYQLFEPTSR